ncbi:AfsR/SARP family transcriptional regulator, partial [Streptomyces mesophilus]|uniref:AfsR/SARP family transcriptional regulator n=1 Tax=Streptomyces mesophilus TaxID=1775132 RepID=UPI0033233322
MVLVRVLGSFAAEVGGGSVPLGGPRQRGVLALLVAARGQVVPVDRMVEDLWRGEPPSRALASLQAYVSNLRRLLEPGRPPRTPARLLVSASPGYALRLPPDAVDAWRFEDMLDQARTCADPRIAHARLDEALALWQGPAFAEVADEPWAAAETARLGELRLVARELRTAVGMRLGAPAAAVPEAESLTRDAPLREEGWRLHALALWSSGRQA